MTGNAYRPLNGDEKTHINHVFTRLYGHFKEWPSYHGDPAGLIAFAEYEGCTDSECCRDILNEATPFAEAQALVDTHGLTWVMIEFPHGGQYGVMHPALDEPISLAALGTMTEDDIAVLKRSIDG
ncbi:MAG: hypothetical protein AAF432_01825 [Planctomycetota bacterium]